MANINERITVLKGVGTVRAAAFNKLGVETIYDALRHFPSRHEDRRDIKSTDEIYDGEFICVSAVLGTPVKTAKIRTGLTISKAKAYDDGGVLELVFFNRKFLENQLILGTEYVFFGKVTKSAGKISMQNPEFERADAHKITGRMVPVYPMTAGITRGMVRNLVSAALAYIDGSVPDYMSSEILKKEKLCDLSYAYRNVHFPEDEKAAEHAVERLAFDEFLVWSAALAQMRVGAKKKIGVKMHDVDLQSFYAALPFTPTGAQMRATADVQRDMCGSGCMNRLVQGDVGSGKTLVAAAAALLSIKNGYQVSVMAPTEILATQHYKSFSSLLAGQNIKIELLTGSTAKREKADICARLGAGEIDLIIGTHALIEDGVVMKNAGLCVIDEQHRFGVKQRSVLSEKAHDTHTLVMSATPIPRTLTLIIYGELDVSIIDEMPKGRRKIGTYVVGSELDRRLYGFIEKQVELGAQVYVVCPLALENEDSDLKSAVDYAAHLKEVFQNYNIGMLHGKLKAAEKKSIMESFVCGKTNVLVSTTVIEVGVDVPNASLLVVRNAERFGLSQLHQLRGRVGRGERQSYCVLVSDVKSEASMARLKVIEKTADGFEIAEADLKARGPGDFFGDAQHGLPQFSRICSGAGTDVINRAQIVAKNILETDPKLVQEENRWIDIKVKELRQKMGETPLN